MLIKLSIPNEKSISDGAIEPWVKLQHYIMRKL